LGPHFAAWCGNIAALRSYNSKESLNPRKDENGRDLITALHLAVSSKHKSAVEILLQVDPTAVHTAAAEWEGATPLHIATLSRDPDILNMLLNVSGRNISVPDVSGRTPVHYAAILGNINAARILKSHGASTIAPDTLGYTPVHYAVRRQNIGVLQIVKDGGGSDQADYEGITPFVLAVQLGGLEMVKCLYSDSINDDEFKRAVEEAKRFGHREVADYLSLKRQNPHVEP